ncbi:MAG: hypothetical protein QOF24_1832 [Verrucomicrobiota bacterium]|jgi:hypothetical protein
MPTLYKSELEAHREREFRPWRCFGIFVLRCFILSAELCILTALLYWANRAVGVAGWLRICTAIALLVWGGFAWFGLKTLINVWVRARFARFIAKLIILLSLVLMFDIALQITYPA